MGDEVWDLRDSYSNQRKLHIRTWMSVATSGQGEVGRNRKKDTDGQPS